MTLKSRVQTGSRLVSNVVSRVAISFGYSEQRLFNLFYQSARSLGYPTDSARIMATLLTKGKKAIAGKGHMISAKDVVKTQAKALDRILTAKEIKWRRNIISRAKYKLKQLRPYVKTLNRKK